MANRNRTSEAYFRSLWHNCVTITQTVSRRLREWVEWERLCASYSYQRDEGLSLSKFSCMQLAVVERSTDQSMCFVHSVPFSFLLSLRSWLLVFTDNPGRLWSQGFPRATRTFQKTLQSVSPPSVNRHIQVLWRVSRHFRLRLISSVISLCLVMGYNQTRRSWNGLWLVSGNISTACSSGLQFAQRLLLKLLNNYPRTQITMHTTA